MFEYAKKLSNDEYFYRYVAIKQIITQDKKIFIHKSIIFFSDFDIKRLAFSKHLLIDGKFIFPRFHANHYYNVLLWNYKKKRSQWVDYFNQNILNLNMG